MKRVLYVVLLLFIAMPSKAQKYSNEFLAIGVSARAHAMGGAVAANCTDVTSGYWNPAGLTRINAPIQLGAMHAEWFAGIAQYDYIGVAKKLNPEHNSVGAITIIRMGVDQIPNTLNLVGPDGSINYDNVTEFSAADYGALVSYARDLSNNKWSVGGNLKVIRRIIGDFGNSWGFGLDAGVQYRSNNFTLAVMARDLTSTFNAWSFSLTEEEKQVFTETGNEIPESSTEITNPRFILAGAYKRALSDKIGLLAEIDFEFTTDGQRNVLINSKAVNIDPRFGFELDYKELVFLRGGVNNIQRIKNDLNSNDESITVQPNFGLGLKIGQLQLDYALTNIGNVSEVLYSHIFSIVFNFREKVKD